MRRKLPALRSDAEAERFVSTSDLTQYDLTRMRLVHFEVDAKDKTAIAAADDAVDESWTAPLS